MSKMGVSSLSALSKLSSVHRNTIYPLVNGVTSPFSESFLSICRALNVSPFELISEAESDELKMIKDGLKRILTLLNQNSNQIAFFLYGSRANQTAREFSDYDIGMTGGENRISWRYFLDAKEILDSHCEDLPVKVSLLNFDEAPNSFLDDFNSKMQFLLGNKESFYFFRGLLNGRAEKA
jgi:predicted nucleotidyltransferase